MRIQFTLERENCGILPFLDMSIRREKNSMVTKVYRKETHTQRYINWKSNHPKNCLLGVLKGLVHRAHVLCDLKQDLIDKLELLHDVFIANGYPAHLVEKTIQDSWKIEMIKGLKEQFAEKTEEKEEDYHDVFHAPYVQGISEVLQNELSKLEVGFVMKKGRTLQSELCKLKPKRNLDEKKNVIYNIKCTTCEKKYIGETGHQFRTRKKQHQADVRNKCVTNGIFMHLRQNKKHKIDWDSNKFIDSEENVTRRKIKEELYINACDPSERPVKLMNLEKGWKINPCWNELRSVIKQAGKL